MIRIFIIITAILSFAGCSPRNIEEFADNEKEAIATNYIEKIISGDFEEIEDAIELSLKPKLTDDVLQQMRGLLGTDKPKEKNLIGYRAHTYNQEPTRYNLTYQYGYQDRWVLVNVAFRTLPNGTNDIFGLNVYNPMDRPLQEVHKFTFEAKGLLHYIFLVSCTLVPLFILTTLIVAIRTKFKKRKWLWIIFILVGIVQFSLNWTTGQIGFKILNFQLFGSGAFTVSAYAPWILSFSLPIGAFLFWINRDKLKYIKVQPDASENADNPRV